MKKNNFEKYKIFIATPCYGGMVTEGYMISILNLTNKLKDLGATCMIRLLSNESLITRARNSLATEFLLGDFTHLFFIDADISFTVDEAIRLFTENKPFVGGTYPQKNINWNNIIKNVMNPPSNVVNNLEALEACSHNYSCIKENNNKHTDNFIKVKAIPTGFMLLKKEVLIKMTQKYSDSYYINYTPGYNFSKAWNFFNCMIDPENKNYLSEDYSFCYRWKKIGGEILLDTKSKLNHTGYYTFKGDYSKVN